VQQVLPVDAPPDEARRRAIALLSGMVGGLAIARALEKADPALSGDVLAAAREQLARLATAPQRPAEGTAERPMTAGVSGSIKIGEPMDM